MDSLSSDREKAITFIQSNSEVVWDCVVKVQEIGTNPETCIFLMISPDQRSQEVAAHIFGPGLTDSGLSQQVHAIDRNVVADRIGPAYESLKAGLSDYMRKPQPGRVSILTILDGMLEFSHLVLAPGGSPILA